ncbi:MAG: DUF3516 domain-containing protein [Proteobacteria bacterium]|nr:DUF3516 domain-containing protein [Pseudomonadota bacterium]
MPVSRLIDRVPDTVAGSKPLDGDAILDRFLDWVAGTGLEPYPAQEQALLELTLDRHVVLSTPTGSGKSLVALGLHFKALCEGRRSFYTAPVKALVSEKFFALCETFGPENVGMLTGDASINWGAPVICCTAEVLSNMALRQGEDCDAPYVVMDEFHYYADRDRGVAWQVPLLILRHSTFLLMSATLGNTAVIEEYIRQRTGRDVAHVHSDERPVPLDFEYRETPLLETVERLREEGKTPVYIVHFTQRDAAERAQGLTSGTITTRDERRAIADALGDFRFDTPYGRDVRRFVGHGIGIHHAGLLPKYRLLVEQLAQQGLLKVICGTDTLGVGVNIPIRTVLFSSLSKFDGEKVRILPVGDFKQIAGRAGRKGFDDRGSVVSQAPEHIVANKRLAAKAVGRGSKPVRKKPPRNFVSWNAETFRTLIARPPETLESRFEVNHGMLVSCLQRGAERGVRGSGFALLAELISLSHGSPRRKKRLQRRAAQLFRSLRRAGVVELERGRGGRREVRVNADLQRDFSLHQSLSLYLVEASAVLDPDSPSYALDLLSVVEAIQEDPRPILQAQRRAAREVLLGQLKADGVPYEERITRLDEVTWPKPAADFIYATFDLFAESHPWVEGENIRPKSVARELYESYASFEDLVRRYGLQRMEGLLLRYLGQVHSTLVHAVPETARTEQVFEMIGFLHTALARVDTSLIAEWERLMGAGAGAAAGPPPPGAPEPRRAPELWRDPRALRARVRAELHQLVRALAQGRYEEAAACVRADPQAPSPWTAERFRLALAPFLEEYERIVFDPPARRNDLTWMRERESRLWDVRQVLVDPAGDNQWNVEAELDLRTGDVPAGPLLAVRAIGI